MKSNYQYDLLYGKSVEFERNVWIKVPTVEEVVNNENFDLYTTIFTLTTRELFQTQRNLEELVKKYPNLWSIMMDQEADNYIGGVFHEKKSVSMILMEALHYWTGLSLDGDGGFHKHLNGKFVHVDSEWVFDYNTYKEFGDVIKEIIYFEPNEDLPPLITSDARYDSWMKTYEGRMKKRQKNAQTWADRIIALSISASAYIPIEEIRKMSIYHFYKLFKALASKEAYETKLQYQLSPKYESDKHRLTHWRDTLNR